MKNIVTRFAPSPTGYLHIGGARTALLNYIFAKSQNGQFKLRIEDTDKERSNDASIQTILNGLEWLGLGHDDVISYQSKNIERHQQIAKQLIDNGNAYYCYCSKEELSKMREEAVQNGHKTMYNRKWRDSNETPPKDVKPVIRIKSNIEGKTTINDQIQGVVSVDNNTIDDFVILREDGTPTYMLSVCVDDYDQSVTHIIRGDDHLNNTFRQIQIYNAMGWEIPVYAHVPLIHGDDGKKLSKRHGALSVESYKEMGYLHETIISYLGSLGWSYEDKQEFTMDELIKYFNIDKLGKSPSMIDFKKLDSVNHQIMKSTNDDILFDYCDYENIDNNTKDLLIKGIQFAKVKAKTIIELKKHLEFYVNAPKYPFENDKMNKFYDDEKDIIPKIINILYNLNKWDLENLEQSLSSFAKENDIGFGFVGKPMRARLSGTMDSPNIHEILFALGKNESIKRLKET